MANNYKNFHAKYEHKYSDTGMALAEAMFAGGATEKTVLTAISSYTLDTEQPAQMQAASPQEIIARSVFPFTMNCPNCRSSMRAVNLAGGKRAAFCSKDRVCLPFKVTG
jgi:hypothetical protein